MDEIADSATIEAHPLSYLPVFVLLTAIIILATMADTEVAIPLSIFFLLGSLGFIAALHYNVVIVTRSEIIIIRRLLRWKSKTIRRSSLVDVRFDRGIGSRLFVTYVDGTQNVRESAYIGFGLPRRVKRFRRAVQSMGFPKLDHDLPNSRILADHWIRARK